MNKRLNTKNNLLLALGINILVLIIYICFFHPYLETTDDFGISNSIEGIWGGRSSHLVYENMVLGKFLCVIQALIPQVKWYHVLQYAMLFLAFTSVSYVFLRIAGKRTGGVSSIFCLLLLGYNTYIVFQFTRTAAITTAAGMIILFYAMDYGKTKKEKAITLAVGFLLCVFGSMIRFQFFAVAVVLAGGIGVYRIVYLLKTGELCWKKKIITYFIVFGFTGAICCAGYFADRFYYYQNDEWNYYLEYNKLRGELWDLGFPDYAENEEVYAGLGISENDLEFYKRWNFDEEKLPIETLRKLVAVKDKTTLNAEVIKNYFLEYPKSFLEMPLFGIFLFVSLIAVALNRRNLMLACFEFAAIMGFELYFFVIGRCGYPRIDTGMWMVAVASILYGMSEELGKLHINKKIMIVLTGGILIMNLREFSGNITNLEDKTHVRDFFDVVLSDKENLYLLPTSLQPNLGNDFYGFWEPAAFGEWGNLHYMGGWDFNLPVKKEMLQRYGVDNIYKDSINNNNIFFVTNANDVGKIKSYICENYENVVLNCVKYVKCGENDVYVSCVRSGDIRLDDGLSNDLSVISHDIDIVVTGNTVAVSGYVYKKDSNSFKQRAYLKVEEDEKGAVSYYDIMMSKDEDNTDIMNGAYSTMDTQIVVDRNKYHISIVLEADGDYYEIVCSDGRME
ncbi:MAG: hypothetical protein HFG80_02250 [Eubacterium sp.]|nr:hypothetical protein [Eubacterium sp.]